MLDEMTSTRCVNYRECGGNVTLLPGSHQAHQGRAEVVGHTCACVYTDHDVTWFDEEIARGRAHP